MTVLIITLTVLTVAIAQLLWQRSAITTPTHR